MKPQRQVPPEWEQRMERRGFTHNGKASIRSLARAAGVAVGAATRVIFLENFGEDTALKIGKALGDEDFVANWIAVDLGSDYTPPTSARKLSPRQRRHRRGLRDRAGHVSRAGHPARPTSCRRSRRRAGASGAGAARLGARGGWQGCEVGGSAEMTKAPAQHVAGGGLASRLRA